MDPHFESDNYFDELDFNVLGETANRKDIQSPIDNTEDEQEFLEILIGEPLEFSVGTPLKNKPMEEEESPVLGSTDDSDSPAEDVRDEAEERASKIVKKKISKAEKPKKAAKTPAEKRPQNPLKNAAGTITAKLKKCAEEESDLYKFVCAYLGFTEEKKVEYKASFLGYNKNDKTWNKIDEFVDENNDFGVFLTEMGIAFLSKAFENEYNQFIENGQLSDDNKDLYLDQENKDLWTSKFMAMRKKYLGNDSTFEADMRATKKTLKSKKNFDLVSEDSVMTPQNMNIKGDSIDEFFVDFNEIQDSKDVLDNELNFYFNSKFRFEAFME